MKKTNKSLVSALILFGFALAGCGDGEKGPNQTLAESVDVERFMGKWYVHGFTPTFLDKKAVNATESYALREDGKIQTTYVYRKGSPTGKEKSFKPVGWVYDEETRTEWRMRFFGLFTSPYYILYVDDAYETTVVGHPGKKMAWIMSRSPGMEDDRYDALLQELIDREYDLTAFRRMLQEW